MSAIVDHRVLEQSVMGWQLRARTDHGAVLYFPGTTSGSVLVNLIMTFVTFGLWLIVWVILECLTVPSQTLIIEEIDGAIVERIVKS